MKKATKILCGILGLGFLLTGCATVDSVQNKDSELVYMGTSAVMINDSYLYFGNAVSDRDFESDSDYKSAAKLSYLARLSVGASLSAKGIDYSPTNVETVASEVVSTTNNFMFALGNYIYYLTPNRKKFTNDDGQLEQEYSYSTLYRSKLDGNSKKELYTTEADISRIEVLKFGGKYYIVMLAGTDLFKFELGSSVTKTKLASDVTSVAIPETYEKNKVGSTLDWNGYIYFTKTRSNDDNSDVSGTSIRKVLISSGSEDEVVGGQGQTVTLVGRENDIIFYTYDSETYKIDTNKAGQFTIGSVSDLYSSSTISDVYKITTEIVDDGTKEISVLGYVYTSNSNLVYKKNNGDGGTLTLNYDGSALSDYDVLFVTGRTMYLATSTAIYCADISSAFNGNGGNVAIACRAVVKMDSIYLNEDASTKYDRQLYAYDGTYIYYYATLQSINSDDDDDDDATVDGKYYLYRTKVGTNADNSPKTPYELLSLTKNSNRHS
jgi:hypothetical protein